MTTYVKCANCGLEMTLPRPVREWHEPRHEDHLRYAFIEWLPDDAPPSLLRSFHSLRWSDGLEAFVVDMDAPKRWQYWTPSGWADLTSRVCVCERPSE